MNVTKVIYGKRKHLGGSSNNVENISLEVELKPDESVQDAIARAKLTVDVALGIAPDRTERARYATLANQQAVELTRLAEVKEFE